MTAFSTLALKPATLANLDSLGYHEMTEIQAAALPAILEGRDLIAQAKTGSGKTAAFGLGLLARLNPAWFAVQALVLCPTRELADQVAQELRRLARMEPNIKILTLTGGSPMRPQMASLEHGAHIVVGTPGRIRDHLGRASLDLSKVQTLVLDEADRMTDMGFYEEIAGIVSACPVRRQTLLFSATYPDDIRAATASFLRDPLEVTVESRHDSAKIEQRFYEIGFDERDEACARLLAHFKPESSLVFCNTKVHCRELLDHLRGRGIAALALYGDLEQKERDEILVLFSNRSCRVLVATDVAARGLDISSLGAVINADVSRDPEVHVHRVGRTGRAGETGLALTLCAPNEKKFVKAVEQYQGADAVWHPFNELDDGSEGGLDAAMVTLAIQGGKRDKLRPGDLLGALTGEAGLTKDQVGKINVFEFVTYVALERSMAKSALARWCEAGPYGDYTGNIKGRSFKMRFMRL
ncbi:MAG TPA: ATP-dependent RNA helicase DbpA [Burkholderiaceae bacterium]